MSGGHFNYEQYRLDGLASFIDGLIENNDSTELDDFGQEIGPHYPPDIIEKFEETRKTLRLAVTMLHRVDWLVSGDEGEELFLVRWAQDVPNNDWGK
jgi:hypothetical protein